MHGTPEELVEQARAARDTGDTARARACLEAAVAGDPGWDLPRLALAELLVGDASDLDQASTCLDQAEVIRADNPRLHRIRGELLQLRHDDAGAAEAYGRSLALRDDPDLRLRRALALVRLGRESEATAELERLRAARPRDAAARANLAELYERSGKTASAEAELVTLSDLAPDQAGPLIDLARFYGRHGQAEKAKKMELRARGLEGTARRLRPLSPHAR